MPTSQTSRRSFLAAGALGAIQAGFGLSARAQEVVRLLVGFPAGGAIDSTARVYAEAAQGFGAMVVDNRPGAAGNIAAGALAQSRPDGATLMFAPVNVYCISKALYHNVPFDAARDFAPVGVVAAFPWALAVHPSIPVNSVAEFVQWVKANPTKANCGMAAIGSEGHLMAYAFCREAGINLNFVAYKGGAPMAQDLMAGHIPMAFDAIPNMVQPHKAEKIRVLAVTSAERAPALNAVPTFHELQYPSATGDSWIGASVRQGTPVARIRAFSAAFNAASNRPDVRERLGGLGLVTKAGTPEQMAALMNSDTERYSALVKAIGLKLD